MDLLVPAYEVADPLFDADPGPIIELPFGAPQIGRREAHVPRLVGVPLDSHGAPERPPDELDQAIQPHPRATANVDRDGAPTPPTPPAPRAPGAGGPLHPRPDPVPAVRNIGIVPLARPVAVHPDGAALGDQIRKAMDGQVRPLSRAVHCEKAEASDAPPRPVG